MSQYPPPAFPSGYVPDNSGYLPPPRNSGAAIASLVLGILGCIPLLTGCLAIIFGVAGIHATKVPSVRGRGLAIAGLILGIVSLVAWTGFGGMIFLGIHATAPARAETRLFLQELSAGNVNAAMKRCAPSVSRSSVQQLSDQMQTWGAFQDATFASFYVNRASAESSDTVGGTLRFQNATKSASFILVKNPVGSLKIQEWKIQ